MDSIVKVFTKYDPPILHILVPTVAEIIPSNLEDSDDLLEWRDLTQHITYHKSSVEKGLNDVEFVTYKRKDK